MNLRLFGEYIVVSPVEEEMSGELKYAANAEKPYDLGVIMSVGDGQVKTKEKVLTRPIHRKAGETVLFKIPAVAIKPKTYVLEPGEDGKKLLIIHQGDIIATIKGTRVDIETFQISGEYVLLEFFETDRFAGPGSPIVLPENAAKELVRLRFNVLQVGDTAFPDGGVKVGDEVLVDRMRLEPIILADPLDKQGGILLVPKSKDYLWCHRDVVHGVVEK